jgi:hypothetical protein
MKPVVGFSCTLAGMYQPSLFGGPQVTINICCLLGKFDGAVERIQLILKGKSVGSELAERCVGHFAVKDVLLRLTAEEFAGDEFNVFGGAQTAGEGLVNLDEVVEIAEVIPVMQPGHVRGGEGDAVAFCQLHVQFNLGHMRVMKSVRDMNFYTKFVYQSGILILLPVWERAKINANPQNLTIKASSSSNVRVVSRITGNYVNIRV